MTDNILSFQIPVITDKPLETSPTGIWEALQTAIETLVKQDGVNEDYVLPGELEEGLQADAARVIYHDVAEFYGWYYTQDDRTIWLGARAAQNKNIDGKTIPLKLSPEDTVPEDLKEIVGAVVKDNFEAMRDADELPPGQDSPEAEALVTDNLTRYIVNWESWFYRRHQEEVLDNYFETAALYEELLDSNYELLGNLIDNGQYDGITDVPYLSEE